MIGRAAALLAAAILAGCSGDARLPLGLSDYVPSAEAISQRLPGRAVEPPRIEVTRAQLAELGITERFMIVELETGASAGMVPLASNRGRIVWATEDEITITGRGGIVAATRGLGGDLLSAETEPLLLALAQGRSARYRRTLRRLDGLRQIRVQPYDCTLEQGPRETVVVLGRAHPTRRAVETCTPAEPSPPDLPTAFASEPFENVYNVGDGTIWTSRQYVGPVVGHLTLERVLE